MAITRKDFWSALGIVVLVTVALPSCRKRAGGVYKVGQTAEQSDYKLTILRIKECELNETEKHFLGKDKTALGVEVILEPTGRGMAYSPTYAKVSDSSGASVTGAVSWLCKPELSPKFVKLTKHHAYQGFITFHVPTSSVGLKLTYQPFMLREQPVTFDLGR
jgi:hypothetical protein